MKVGFVELYVAPFPIVGADVEDRDNCVCKLLNFGQATIPVLIALLEI